MLCGVNVEFTESIALASGVETIASGGVKDIDDITNCKANGNIAGVIVGKAFYEGRLDLEEAFKIL
jgi:phosphoribosylformimino-5-aminoimidazole carboxamide ribotide isomerase